jgi:hypothetical protein
MLGYLKLKGAKIVGVSAPAKGNTLLNYCKIGTETLDYIGEISDKKIGRYTPGMHIPVVHENKIIEEQPDYCLILAWNWKDEIVRGLRKNGYKGKFIEPIPYPKIIE